MNVWHVEPIIEELQEMKQADPYFERMNQIAHEYLGLSTGDLEVLSVAHLSLFLHGDNGIDLGKCLVVYMILEKLLAFETNIFCAAMYRRKCHDFFEMMEDVANAKGLSLQAYVAS